MNDIQKRIPCMNLLAIISKFVIFYLVIFNFNKKEDNNFNLAIKSS